MLRACESAASAVIKPAVGLTKLNNASYKLIPAAYNRKYHFFKLKKTCIRPNLSPVWWTISHLFSF